MNLPFDSPQFFAVFARYNLAVWPAQVVLNGLAIALVMVVLRAWSDRAVSGVLALLWVWMGVVYHLGFFRTINPAASIFGAMFVLQGVVFAVLGVAGGKLRFVFPAGARGMIGGLLLVFALVAYPLLAYLAGHRYPAVATFGLPCPTTIFTLGLLLWAAPPVPRALLLIPLAWSAVGASAALQLGVREDRGLVAAGLVSGLLMLVPVWGGGGPTLAERRSLG